MDGIGDFGDRLAVGGKVQHGTANGRLNVVDTGGGEVHTAVTVGGKIVRADEGLAAAVLANLANLLTGGVQLFERIAVITGDQEVVIEGDETVGATAILMPIDRGTPPVPALDIAGGVLDVKELPITPQRALGIACIRIYGRNLIGQGRKCSETKKEAKTANAAPSP